MVRGYVPSVAVTSMQRIPRYQRTGVCTVYQVKRMQWSRTPATSGSQNHYPLNAALCH